MPYVNYGFNPLASATRKRKALTDPTQDYLYDMVVPNDLPNPTNPVIPQAGGGNKHEMLANILNAIAAGTAVFGSNNPGETLQQQLMQRKQEQMQQQQYQREVERSNTEYQQKTQLQTNEIKAQKEARKEEIKFKKESQTQGEQHDIELNSLRFQNDTNLQKQHTEASIKLQELSQIFQAGEGLKNKDFQKEMEALRTTGDIKQVEIKTVMGALLSASKYHNAAPISTVMDIVHKIDKGIALTKEDTLAIDKAIKINASIGAAGVGQQSKFQQKSYLQLQNDENDIIKGIILKDKTPMINPVTNQPMLDTFGKPVFQNSDPDEIAEKVRSSIKLFRDVTGYNKEQNNVIKQATGNITQSELQVVNNVRKFLDGGGNSSDIDLTQLSGNLQTQVRNVINQYGTKKKRFTIGK